MARFRVVLDSGGIRKILKAPPMRKAVNRAAKRVARGAGKGATVSEYTTDREAASVAVPTERQALDGVLTKAARAAGLEVRQP